MFKDLGDIEGVRTLGRRPAVTGRGLVGKQKTTAEPQVCSCHFETSLRTRWWFQVFLFSPRKLGKIPILTNIFQMGRNHQLENHEISSQWW